MVQLTTSENMNARRVCGCFSRTGLVLLVFFELVRIIGVVIRVLKTIDCAAFHYAFIHCEDGSNVLISYTFAMRMELTTAIFLEVCRLIFLIFCGKLLWPKWKKLKKFKETCLICLFKKFLLPKTLILFAMFGVSVSRLSAVLSYDNLGRMPEVAKAILGLYITDYVLMAIIVIILNYVKIQDLSDCIGDLPCGSWKIHTQRAKEVNLAWYILKFVILLWGAEYFFFLLLASIQIAFDVSEVGENIFVEKPKKHEILKHCLDVLKQFGQIAFLGFVTECLFFKFCDDSEPTVGKRTDENESDTWCDLFEDEVTADEQRELLKSTRSSVYESCESNVTWSLRERQNTFV